MPKKKAGSTRRANKIAKKKETWVVRNHGSLIEKASVLRARSFHPPNKLERKVRRKKKNRRLTRVLISHEDVDENRQNLADVPDDRKRCGTHCLAEGKAKVAQADASKAGRRNRRPRTVIKNRCRCDSCLARKQSERDHERHGHGVLVKGALPVCHVDGLDDFLDPDDLGDRDHKPDPEPGVSGQGEVLIIPRVRQHPGEDACEDFEKFENVFFRRNGSLACVHDFDASGASLVPFAEEFGRKKGASVTSRGEEKKASHG
jgi:hypothetical protein